MSSLSRTTARTEDVETAAEEVERIARPLSADALDRLVEAVGDAQYVLFGEASHGTSEFYRLRARLTARLVCERGVSFVAVEGDWTDCYDVNRFVRGSGGGGGGRGGGDGGENDADEVLRNFDRWPTWMWANWEVREFVEWLREFDADRPADERVGFYGLDVYSLFESMAEVVDYLEDVDPGAAARARDAYHCFSPYGEDAREYARSNRLVPENCEDEVVEILTDIRERASEYARRDGESYFDAEQNALVAKNAEEYYRAMAEADTESWNVRDTHMTETAERLTAQFDGGSAGGSPSSADRGTTSEDDGGILDEATTGGDGMGVIWAHNTHIGDARATDMTDRGRVNVGQLLRERHPDDVAVVGFGTHRGSVIAGEEWGAPHERMTVPAAREGSYGDAFHRADVGDSLVFADDIDEGGALAGPRGQRAIGVVYDPEREWGNYVPTRLGERYDALLHVEETTALHPIASEDGARGPPEAYPWGL